MLTVKEVSSALKEAKKIKLAYDGLAHPFDTYDKLMMDAFGNFVVSAIRGGERGEYELELAMRPVVAE